MKEPGLKFDVIVVGGTAPGVVAALRAAREGLSVGVFIEGRHLGGSLPSLGAFETHYRGNRAPLLQELVQQVIAYYRDRYGLDSAQYRACTGGKMVTFEPHVMTEIIARFVAAEPNITVFHDHVARSVETVDRLINAVNFEHAPTGDLRRYAARSFVEAGYEGDLLALAQVPFRVGRESRSEHREPRAGRVFTQWLTGLFPRDAAEGRLNLVTAGATTSELLPGSTGEGDDNIQSYSYRLCLTDDPSNRKTLESPPSGYDRAQFAPLLLSPEEKEKIPLPFHHRYLIYSLQEMIDRDHIFHGHALPNRKRSWNATNLTGGGKNYALADKTGRMRIAEAHRRHALGLMWFLQNDSAVPIEIRTRAREWGLARDEFADNDHIPHQLYIREARRMTGRALFTEHDALLAESSLRAPIHSDSIAITEFSLDSLACTTDRIPGSLCDGQLFQMEVSRPGQVPFGVLLPREWDNLIVVTTVSATHVGWGTVRQTPTLMHLAESAGWALVFATRREIPVAQIDVRQLQRTLVEHGVMITFFNDFDMGNREPWVAALQYLGARGFFDGYDAAAHLPATPRELSAWRMEARSGASRGELCAEIFGRCAPAS